MLYEPTNIIPSTMTQTGTVAATTDNVNIQWQVNGNSAMTMFQIDVMQNNADSTFVYSTGIVTENSTVAQGYSLPFYGKDRFGDYVQFVYQPNQTWAAWSGNAIFDGNSYKFRITQFFQENGTACKVPITSSLSAGTTYYFSYSVNGTIKYVSFTVANAAYFVGGNTIYFNFSHNTGWVATSGANSRAITDITFSVSETQPSGTQLSGAEAVSPGDTFYNQFFTVQNSASSFITRTEPTLAITPLTTTPVASATQSFTATYSQAQGDSINTVRWQLFNAEDMNAPIDDTGEISTSVLSYEYNGLFDGQSYSVVCTVTTESGVTVASTLDFSVQYEQGTYTGDFTAQSLCREDANLLKWDNIEGISGVDNPSGSAIVSNGQLILPENSTVTWSERKNEDGEMGDLNFSAPWTAVWNGDIDQISSSFLQEVSKRQPSIVFQSNISKNGQHIKAEVNTAAFSPDGSLLVLGGEFSGYASVFSVSGTTITYIADITKSGAALNGTVNTAAFSPDGSLLVLGGEFSGYASVFSVSGTTVTYIKDLQQHRNAASSSAIINLDMVVNAAAFSPNGDLLVIGGTPNGTHLIEPYSYCMYYIENNEIGDPHHEGEVPTETYKIAFNEVGDKFLIGGYSPSSTSITPFPGAIREFQIDNTTIRGGNYLQIEGGYLIGSVRDICFVGDRVVVCGNFPLSRVTNIYDDHVIVYSVQENIYSYSNEILVNQKSMDVSRICKSDIYNYLLFGSGYEIYLFSKSDLSYVNMINTDISSCAVMECFPINSGFIYGGLGSSSGLQEELSDSLALYAIVESNSSVLSCTFGISNNVLILSGMFSGSAFAFENENQIYTYQSNIERDGIYIENTSNTAAFSPDGSLLVLGGEFSSYASVFSVSGTTITYIADIAKSGTALNGAVNTAAFSPDGSLLVLGGEFSGYASVFSVSGNTVTYLNEIVKKGTPLNGFVYTATFSPDENVVALGGSFDGYAAFFVVSNNTIEWVQDILIDESPLNGAVHSLSFNHSGNMIAVGGDFTDYAAILNVETAITNIEKIFEISTNNIYVSRDGQVITAKTSEESILGETYILGSSTGGANNIAISLTPSALQVYSFLDGQYLGMQETELTYTQQTITSAQLQGEQTCNYFSIIDGDGENIAQSLQDSDFVPQWNNAQGYTVDLLADFQYGLDGGTATETGTGFRIYRRKSDGTENIELATLPSTTLSLRDYGIKSNESYIYDFYVYDANGAFMGVRSTEETPLKRQFKRFSLLSTQYNESDKCYHVVKEYQFSCNIQDMAVSNNSNKSYVQNFTPYPTVFQSMANYASGTLQALIGFVDPKAYKYWDSTQLMDELNALSTTTNTLFLKDMKGHLWMIDVGTVQMTATQKTREMQVTISLPWTEIGDASDVSIIQTPDDEGWNTDAQVLDVTLDVDVETGLLQVVYPFPYNGTAFYLVGVTPEGVVNAVQPLPSKASQPTDGQLKAVVRHK